MSSIIDTILEKDILSEYDFFTVLKAGAFGKDHIGKKVKLKNKIDTVTNTIYTIIDIDHDGVKGAVDLMSTFALNEGEKFSTEVSNTLKKDYYENSFARKWLNETFITGFSETVKQKLEYMEIESNGAVLKDKVKLLSATELGIYPINILREGTQYDYLSKKSYKKYLSDGKTLTGYWTRSRLTDYYDGMVYGIETNGIGYGYFTSKVTGIIAVIRFSQTTDEMLLKEQLKEEEFYECLDKGLITKDFIGKLVQIKVGNFVNLFVIIDINHDDVSASVDLMAISRDEGHREWYDKGIDTDGYTDYIHSNIIKYLNDNFYNDLTEGAKSRLLSMNVPIGGNILAMNQKAKIPSMTELGLKEDNIDEGTSYPYFTSEDSRIMFEDIRCIHPVNYWTRSSVTSNDLYAYYIDKKGKPLTAPKYGYNSFNTMPIIRFRNNVSGTSVGFKETYLSEDKFLYCLSKGAITEEYIGKELIIYNHEEKIWCSFIIAAINFGGTQNTVDIISKYCINNIVFDNNTNLYCKSNIRSWLNTFVEGFSDTFKNNIIPYNIIDGENVYQDKIKLLSESEITNGYDMFKKDKVKYIKDQKVPSIWYLSDADPTHLRLAKAVSQFGDLGSYYTGNAMGVVPVIRLSAGIADEKEKLEIEEARAEAKLESELEAAKKAAGEDEFSNKDDQLDISIPPDDEI